MASDATEDGAYTARVVSRTTEPVNRRLRRWAFAEGLKLQVALTLALLRGLPPEEEIEAQLAGRPRSDEDATV